MEQAIEDKLDQKLYPFLSGRSAGSGTSDARRYVRVVVGPAHYTCLDATHSDARFRCMVVRKSSLYSRH